MIYPDRFIQLNSRRQLGFLRSVSSWAIEEQLQQKDHNYCYGIGVKEGVMVKDGWIISITEVEDETYERIEYNIESKEIRMSEKGKMEADFSPIDSNLLDHGSIIDLSDDGMYWEGPSLDDLPFGFGCMYDSWNRLLYRGIFIIDRKDCFGTDFYPDLGVAEYCGCFWNNHRHGMGMLFERTGELLYKGDYLCGSSDYEKCITLNTYSDEYSVHSLIEELVITDYCKWNYEYDMELCGYENLKRIKLGQYCLPVLKCFTISNNPQLNIIEADDNCFYNEHNWVNVVIKSMMIDD